ncbi:Semaphorin-4E [Nibea albiflora]|uniref:Semaphorin-4E n=1 Tax=Nibea albiflora TaxID=240163 RepID=A0ACB7FI41_NIBAL|nr:Semaphorin-4E [Nibea albiflora]
MHPLLSLTVFWLLPLALTLEEDSPLDCVPRRSVPYHRDNALLFREEGVFNYSTMLLREDLGLLVLGASEAVYALDLNDISKKLASVKWEVTQQQKDECKNKGKDPKLDCKNYIRILHETEDNRMYVCGTNAFDPECDYMSYADGKLTLEKKGEDGKGKCPFDPFQRYASIMFENSLYSATSMNFLGSEPVLMRSSPISIRTEFKSSWLHEPNFVSMAEMPESEMSAEGDDDKVYLFFSETAVECDCYNKLVVSRVARVCKGDLGGQRTLQKKWTSFLKARMDCPVLESQLPYIIQDTYRWCDPQRPWKDCLFYAVFTPQSDTSDLSAVCAYRVSDISKVFAEGKYKSPVPVETSFVKWVMYSGEVPVPRPGACINNEARSAGITQTLDLPDRTLQFIKDRPLMDHVIQPIGEKPLMGQLYAGSDYGAVQIPLATCGRSLSCMDCVLSRDPYCGWDKVTGKCILLSSSQSELIQNVKEGNASLCPHADPVKPLNQSIWPGGNLKLRCLSPSSLSETFWERDGRRLTSAPRLQLLRDGLLILNASDSDTGVYRCLSVERSKTGEYTTTVAEFQVSTSPVGVGDGNAILPEARTDGPSVAGLQATIGFLVVSLLALLAWNFYNGHIPLPWNCRKNREQPMEQEGGNSSVAYQHAPRLALAEDKPLVSERDNGTSNNNHAGEEAALGAAEEENDASKVNLPSVQINDESEI